MVKAIFHCRLQIMFLRCNWQLWTQIDLVCQFFFFLFYLFTYLFYFYLPHAGDVLGFKYFFQKNNERLNLNGGILFSISFSSFLFHFISFLHSLNQNMGADWSEQA